MIFAGSVTKAPAKTQTVYDVSWPNCGQTQPADTTSGIIGVNGGLDFRANPCLAKQLSWFSNVSVYLNTGYPGATKALKYKNSPQQCSATNQECLAYNYGFNAARYDIKYASLQGVVANRWWLDVETENSWSDSTLVNRSTLVGMLDAISIYAGGGRIGFYSYPAQWNLITGNWRPNLPAWVASGGITRQDAINSCKLPSFTGGTAVLAQYTNGLDINIAC